MSSGGEDFIEATSKAGFVSATATLVTNAIIHADAAPDVTVRLLRDRVDFPAVIALAEEQGAAEQPARPDDQLARTIELASALRPAWHAAEARSMSALI